MNQPTLFPLHAEPLAHPPTSPADDDDDGDDWEVMLGNGMWVPAVITTAPAQYDHNPLPPLPQPLGEEGEA